MRINFISHLFVLQHASPISDTTVLSSMASQCQLLEHVRTQAPYVLIVVTWSVLVGTIPAAGTQVYPNGVAILLGTFFLLLHVIFTSAKTVNATGKFDCFTALYMWIKKSPDLEHLKEETKRAFENGGVVPEAAAAKTVSSIATGSFKKSTTGEGVDSNEGEDEDVAGFENEDKEESAVEQALDEKEGSEAEVEFPAEEEDVEKAE